MPTTVQPAFSKGEISPALYGRIDSDLYHTGLRRARNIVIPTFGGAQNRAGTKYIGEIKNQSQGARLASFKFNETDSYILEFGHQYIRFIRGDSYVMSGSSKYEVATPYAYADVKDLKFAQLADVVTIVHSSYAPRELKRFGHDNWTLTEINFNSEQSAPTNVSARVLKQGSGTTTAKYTITATNPNNEESLVGLGSQKFSISAITRTDPAAITLNLDSSDSENEDSLQGDVIYGLDGEQNKVYRLDSLDGTWTEISQLVEFSSTFNVDSSNQANSNGGLAVTRGGTFYYSNDDYVFEADLTDTEWALKYIGSNTTSVSGLTYDEENETLYAARIGSTSTVVIEFTDLDSGVNNSNTSQVANLGNLPSSRVALSILKKSDDTYWTSAIDKASGGTLYLYSHAGGSSDSWAEEATYSLGWTTSPIIAGATGGLAELSSGDLIVSMIRTGSSTLDEGVFLRYSGGAFTTLTPTFPSSLNKMIALAVVSSAPSTEGSQGNTGIIQIGDTIEVKNVAGMTELNDNRYTITGYTESSDGVPTITINEDTSSYNAYTSGGNIYPTFYRLFNTSDSEPQVEITWATTTGVSFYSVYRDLGGGYGLLGTTQGTRFVDNFVLADTTLKPRVGRNPFKATTEYPSAVGYYQQRQVFGGSTDEPDTMYFSQTGQFRNFSESSPPLAADAITATLADGKINRIKHFVYLKDLVVLTEGSTWKVFGQQGVISPLTFSAEAQTEIGSSNIPPVILEGLLMYVKDNNSELVNVVYSREREAYVPRSPTLVSQHLFEGREIVAMTTLNAPYVRLFCVLGNGDCAVMSYDRSEGFVAWTLWTTDGEFEDVVSVRIQNSTEDGAYFIVKRTINGATRRYVERTEPRLFDSLNDSFFVDCGQTFTNVSNITGLNHLAGEQVAVLQDGTPSTGTVASDGTLALGASYSKVHVGLPYVAEIETLDLDGVNHTLEGREKSLVSIGLWFKDSVGPNKIATITENQITPQDNSIKTLERGLRTESNTSGLFTGKSRISVNSGWGDNVRIRLTQDKPLPMHVLAISPDYALGEGNTER